MNSSVNGMAEERISKLEDWFIEIEIKNKPELERTEKNFKT